MYHFAASEACRAGLQYFEALGPSIMSSVVATVIKDLVYQRNLGGFVDFPSLPENMRPGYAVAAAVYGVLSGLIAMGFISFTVVRVPD